MALLTDPDGATFAVVASAGTGRQCGCARLAGCSLVVPATVVEDETILVPKCVEQFDVETQYGQLTVGLDGISTDAGEARAVT
jgi:hypothetical protein